MENYNSNIQIIFHTSEEETHRLLQLMTEEEPDLKNMLSQVNIVPEYHTEAPGLYVNDVTRLTADTDLQRLQKTLFRDFLISMPRIAAIRTISLSETGTESTRLFGPYTQEMLFDQQRLYETFDIVVTENQQQALSLLKETSTGPVSCIRMDETQVIIEASLYADDDEMNGQSLRQAIYLALDITRNRNDYDMARRRPLQKLFHDTPDRGERQPRFAPFVPKPAEAGKTPQSSTIDPQP